MCHFCDFRGVVISDFRTERGDEHQRFFNEFRNTLPVRFETRDCKIREIGTGIGEQAHLGQKIENHDGLENVQLEIALCACE